MNTENFNDLLADIKDTQTKLYCLPDINITTEQAIELAEVLKVNKTLAQEKTKENEFEKNEFEDKIKRFALANPGLSAVISDEVGELTEKASLRSVCEMMLAMKKEQSKVLLSEINGLELILSKFSSPESIGLLMIKKVKMYALIVEIDIITNLQKNIE